MSNPNYQFRITQNDGAYYCTYNGHHEKMEDTERDEQLSAGFEITKNVWVSVFVWVQDREYCFASIYPGFGHDITIPKEECLFIFE